MLDCINETINKHFAYSHDSAGGLNDGMRAEGYFSNDRINKLNDWTDGMGTIWIQGV